MKMSMKVNSKMWDASRLVTVYQSDRIMRTGEYTRTTTAAAKDINVWRVILIDLDNRARVA